MAGSLKVGFIGLGQMGLPLYRRVAAKFPSSCWALHPPRTSDHDFKMATGASEAVREANVIVTCLPNSDVVRQIYNDIQHALIKDSVWIDCTSGDPSISKSLSEHSVSNSRHFLDCAVSGGPLGAQKGHLTTMVGGDVQAFDQSKVILETFARKIVYIGPSGTGHAVKAINNALLAIGIWSAAEGLLALKKLGVSPSQALEAINSSSGRSWATMQRYPDHVIPRTFDYGFSLDLLKKDLATACRVLKEADVPARMMGEQLSLVEQAIEYTGPTADHLEMIKLLEKWSQACIEE